MSNLAQENLSSPADLIGSRSPDQRPHHILIAGTGRSGTSFLVRYLDALGLDTRMSREGDLWWSESANAGLEDLPLAQNLNNLPYVIKSPWIGEFIEQLLREDRFKIDAVIVPIRNLRDAASSRVILERRNVYESSPWMYAMDETWDDWCITPGGVIYSLDPVDQERLLAVKFAQLVQSIVRADLKLILLDFPRIIQDPAYLFGKLEALVPAGVDLQFAVEAHGRVADERKVRVAKERRETTSRSDLKTEVGANHALDDRRRASMSQLDLITLRREIARLKHEGRDLRSRDAQIADLSRKLAEATAPKTSAPAEVVIRASGLRGILQRFRPRLKQRAAL